MNTSPCVLLVGTADTKSDELLYLRERIQEAGANARVMDVGVLQSASFTPDIPNHAVAAAAGTTLAALQNCGDENTAMAAMARGAASLAVAEHAQGHIHGLLALGGSMGTDLALDVAAALPLGVPKVVLSTIAHSHLLPPERIAPDLIMLLWAGGLYGLNELCRASLALAAGAVVGACRAARPPQRQRPVVGMTSLGKSCLAYMVALKPALEARGFDVAVFHTTGMGGRAFEALAQQGHFCAVMDFSLQELVNDLAGSVVTSGVNRLRGAGQSGTPQIVAPGACDMVDYATASGVPAALQGQAVHEHNRLIASTSAPISLRQKAAQEIGQRLKLANGPTCLLLPNQGIEEWDKPGAPMHNAPALAAFNAALRNAVQAPTRFVELNAHINDAAFADAALKVFDEWVAAGVITRAAP